MNATTEAAKKFKAETKQTQPNENDENWGRRV